MRVAASPSTAHGQSKSTTGLRANPSAPPRIEFIAVSGNDALLEQVGQALDGESAIRQVDTVESARDLIRAAPCCVVLLEIPTNAQAAELVSQLHAPSGTSVVVVFAPVDETAAVARSITATAAFAVLPVPLEIAKTAAVLEGARDEALSRHALLQRENEADAPSRPAQTSAEPDAHSVHVSPNPETADERAADTVVRPRRAGSARDIGDAERAASSGAISDPPRGGRKNAVIAACVAVAIVAAAIGWYLTRDGSTSRAVVGDATPRMEDSQSSTPRPEREAADVTVGATADIKHGAVEDLLDLARTAFSERRYTDPKSESALVYYRSVLAQEPDNEEAREGLARIAVVLDERLQSALNEGRYDDASLTVSQLKLAGADPSRVHDASARIAVAQISAALARDNADRAAALLRQAETSGALSGDEVAKFRAELDKQQGAARTKRLVDLVEARVRAGRLLEPADDSAQYYVGQLRKLPNAGNASKAAERSVEDAVLGEARAAGLRRQNDELERWLAEARKLGVSKTRIAAVRREVRSQPATPAAQLNVDVERLAGLVQTRINDGRLLEPAQDSAVFYLGQLRTIDVAGTRYSTSSRAVADRLLQRGREAVAERKPELAQSLAAAARPIAANPADVEALEGEIARLVADAAARASTEKLKRTRYVAPEYPRDAVLRGTEGSVRVRITVGADGTVTDSTIVESNPPRTFDKAAINAVRRWRFEPLNPAPGEPQEIVLESTVVFKIDDAGR